MVGTSISLTMVLSRVGQNDLARVMVLIRGEKELVPVVLVGHDNGVEGVVVKFCRRFVSEVNMGVAHEFEFCQAQCLFGDGMMDDVLFHGREAVREEGDKFHHQVGCAPEGLGVQGFVEEGDGSTLMLLGNLDMDSLHNLVLGLCKGGGGGGSCSERGRALGVLAPSQMFLNWKPRAMGGLPGLSQCKMVSKSSVRQQRSVFSCE